MNLPTFRYHPDPIATGSVEASAKQCKCCDQQRGYIYVGPIYSAEALESVCPWCIADGSAHEKFAAEFTDAAGVGDNSAPAVPLSVIEQVAFRTPGFTGWQQERWLGCCGDAAAFVGRAGQAELEKKWPDAIPSIQEECGMTDGEDWEGYFGALDIEGSPTAYIFQCLHCNSRLGYSDCD